MTTNYQVQRPWALATDLVRTELDAYLAVADLPGVTELETRCTPWTVADLTAHLACTFQRFGTMLERSRNGNLAPPFAPEDLRDENLRVVASFRGDPFEALSLHTHDFLRAVRDPHELMAHQFGPIPVGLQVLFGLGELAIHHHDVAEARGESYRPSEDVIAALLPVWDDVLGDLPTNGDRWAAILTRSGR